MTTSAIMLDRLLDPVSRCFSEEVAKAFINLRADPDDLERTAEWAEKSREGLLSATEQREYETYAQAVSILSILQAKARLHLQQHLPG